MTRQIIVERGKHGDTFWDASTPEALAKSALAILKQRFEWDFYYEPEKAHGTGEWAEKHLAEREAALAITDEQIAAMPEQYQAQAKKDRDAAQRAIVEEKEYADWYVAAKKIADNNDLSFITVGRNKYARQVPKAWYVLSNRSDHEYEGLTLEYLQTGDDDD